MARMVKLTKTPVQKKSKIRSKKKAQRISQYQLIDNRFNYAPRFTHDTKKSPNQIGHRETISSSSGGLELILESGHVPRRLKSVNGLRPIFSTRYSPTRDARKLIALAPAATQMTVDLSRSPAAWIIVDP